MKDEADSSKNILKVYINGIMLSVYDLCKSRHLRGVLKIALQLYLNCISPWVFSCKFAAYFQNTFSGEHLWTAPSVYGYKGSKNMPDMRNIETNDNKMKVRQHNEKIKTFH